MPFHVDICDDVLEEIESWGLPDDVRTWLFSTMDHDLSTRIASAIGERISVAPLLLYRYCLARIDPTGDFLHNFAFLVGDERAVHRRVVRAAKHRIKRDEF